MEDINPNISISDPTLRKAIYEAFNRKCFYTGKFIDQEDMVIDHLIPKSKGGEDSIYNYVLTDHRLNTKKSNHLDADFIEPTLYVLKTAYIPRVIKLLKRYRGESPKKSPPQKKKKDKKKKVSTYSSDFVTDSRGREWCDCSGYLFRPLEYVGEEVAIKRGIVEGGENKFTDEGEPLICEQGHINITEDGGTFWFYLCPLCLDEFQSSWEYITYRVFDTKRMDLDPDEADVMLQLMHGITTEDVISERNKNKYYPELMYYWWHKENHKLSTGKDRLKCLSVGHQYTDVDTIAEEDAQYLTSREEMVYTCSRKDCWELAVAHLEVPGRYVVDMEAMRDFQLYALLNCWYAPFEFDFEDCEQYNGCEECPHYGSPFCDYPEGHLYAVND